ncbi:MAG: hypothetical protein QXI16_07790 [Sulfolobaceae archaeon]
MMLTEWMLELGVLIFHVIFAMLGVLPELSPSIINAIDYVFELMFSSVNLVNIFIDISMVKRLIPLTIAVLNFDHIIKFVTYILKKIPMLGIE